MTPPLLIVTNDDGIRSPGLRAAAQALAGLGEIVVVAPKAQQTSVGRAFYWGDRKTRPSHLRVGRRVFRAYAVDGSPALTMRYALMLVAKRKPALVVSGINYGENVGNGLTISGTVGAALEAIADGVPALAVSLQTEVQYHTTHSRAIDFSVAAHFARKFAEIMLRADLPPHARLLNVNVPRAATPATPWRLTRASRQSYFRSLVKDGHFAGYDIGVNLETLEPQSDIHALVVDHVVSVTPLNWDLTARVNLPTFAKLLADADA